MEVWTIDRGEEGSAILVPDSKNLFGLVSAERTCLVGESCLTVANKSLDKPKLGLYIMVRSLLLP